MIRCSFCNQVMSNASHLPHQFLFSGHRQSLSNVSSAFLFFSSIFLIAWNNNTRQMGSMYYYELIYRSVGSIIYGCKMISFTTNLEIMSKVGAQRNETFRGGIKYMERIQPQIKLKALRGVTGLIRQIASHQPAKLGTRVTFKYIFKLF